jgi:hypothetical protein
MREVGVLERAKAHAAIQRIRARAERHRLAASTGRHDDRTCAAPFGRAGDCSHTGPANQRPRGRKAGLPCLDTMKMLTGIFGM